MRTLLLMVHQHGGDDVTCKPIIDQLQKCQNEMQIHMSLTCVLKTKDHLDDTIVLCMIVRRIVYSAYHYSPFTFGLYFEMSSTKCVYI
jgi:hypothetical protein